MDSGIYSITNSVTGDQYVGSAKSIKARWRRHKKDLRKGAHHSIFLLRSWNKYGEQAFVFHVLETCKLDLLCERENHYLQKLSPSFNNCPTAYCQIGRKLSPEHIAKIKAYVKNNNIRPPASTWLQKMRSVEMLDRNTDEVLNRFESLSSACRHVGRTHRFASTIASCCNGGRHKTYLGYKWKWAK